MAWIIPCNANAGTNLPGLSDAVEQGEQVFRTLHMEIYALIMSGTCEKEQYYMDAPPPFLFDCTLANYATSLQLFNGGDSFGKLSNKHPRSLVG